MHTSTRVPGTPVVLQNVFCNACEIKLRGFVIASRAFRNTDNPGTNVLCLIQKFHFSVSETLPKLEFWGGAETDPEIHFVAPLVPDDLTADTGKLLPLLVVLA